MHPVRLSFLPLSVHSIPAAFHLLFLSGYEEGRRSAEKFIALVDKYQNFEELTTYMLNEFVEKIVVHERDRKGSVETTQEVEIYFNFIGRYLPPHFGEVKMTPEEIEEMEKREARKDRLHQNYLRRKESPDI